ncbi:MAG: S8 family serine peptidase [Candidatus Uhrbacteria bacterium]|nr:S8 family serine peptidase [Candidatus Uhrbacteria bacterium]
MSFAVFFIVSLALSLAAPALAVATVTLSKSEIQHGDFFDIYGTGFGNGTSSYSFVCFGSTNLCVNGAQIVAQPPLSWSDTQIHMQLPGGVPTEGEIIVVGEGTQTVCDPSGGCQTTKFHEDKGRANYKVRPKIDSLAPNAVIKPGDSIKIIGNGFGDTGGSIFFDDIQGIVSNWDYTSIDVSVPSSLSKNTRLIRVVSRNGLQAEKSQIVSMPLSSDELSYQQYYLNQINVPGMWQTPPNKDVIVAVLDDGVYANHPDLAGRIWTNTREIPGNGKDDDGNGFIDDYLGYNFLDNTAAVDPKGGHGTFVAGIIGAVRNNGIGIAGIADRVKIMPIIISDGKTSSSLLVRKGVQYAIDNGADIVNISFASLGTLGFSQQDNSIYQNAFEKGVLIVVAAGNRDLVGGIGQNLNLIPESPVCNNNNSQNMLGVAALDNTDGISDGKKKATWASYGSNCVFVSAPGTSIISTTPPLFQKDQKFYDAQSGSSFSAPVVAGVAAYLKSVHPEWKNWDIINRIIATAQSIDQYNPDYAGQLGGRIDAQSALERSSILPSGITLPTTSPRAGDTIRVHMNGFLSDYSMRLTDKASTDVPIPLENITARAANEFDITLPRSLHAGSYFLRITSPVLGEIAISQNTLSVLDALPVPITQSIITVPTYLVPSFDKPESVVFPLPSTTPSTAPIIQPVLFGPPTATAKRLAGIILLQVQSKGEAWYVYPVDFKRYYLGRPTDAFQIMRRLSLGVTHQFVTQYSVYPDRVVGRILLDTEDHGKAYYIYPKNKRAYYLGRPEDAFQIMRQLGLGITNADIERIAVGF